MADEPDAAQRSLDEWAVAVSTALDGLAPRVELLDVWNVRGARGPTVHRLR